MLSSLLSADTELAKSRYARLAERYDFATRRMEPVRARAIAQLCLRPGDRVLDVACGTGKSFDALRRAVGPRGEVVGIDASPDMIEQARQRIAEAGWDNVRAIEAPMESAPLDGPYDAVLFVYTQDVLQSEAALAHIFSQVAPGAPVVSTGLKLFPWYLGALNFYLLAVSWRYFTSFRGLRRPYRPLHRWVPDLRVSATFLGSGYLAWGHRRG